MSTDYLNRVYWPRRSTSAKRTTYDIHYGSQALLDPPGDDVTQADSHEARLDALRLLEKRPTTAAEPARPRLAHTSAYSSWTAVDPGERPSRPKSYSSRKTLPPSTSVAYPCAVTLQSVPTNDPFVPNSSYKEFLKKKRRVADALAKDDQRRSADHALYRLQAQQLRLGVSETSTRMGRGGGSWRHVKEVLQGMGTRIVFIDGGPSLDDLHRMRSRQARNDPTAAATDESFRRTGRTPQVSTLEKQASESANWRVMR